MHALHRGRLTGLLVIPIIMLIAACSSGSQAGGAGAGAYGQVAGGATGAATIAISTPADGATVAIPFDVAIDASVPLGDPSTGDHHAHLYFDTGTDAADYDIVYGNTWQVTRQLSPGQHTVTVALANPDHSLAGPTQSITIQVGGAGAGGSGDGAGAQSPSVVVPGY